MLLFGVFSILEVLYLLGGFAISDDLVIFGGVLLHVGDLDPDALVLEVILEVTLVDTFGGFRVDFVGDLDEALEVVLNIDDALL